MAVEGGGVQAERLQRSIIELRKVSVRSLFSQVTQQLRSTAYSVVLVPLSEACHLAVELSYEARS